MIVAYMHWLGFYEFEGFSITDTNSVFLDALVWSIYVSISDENCLVVLLHDTVVCRNVARLLLLCEFSASCLTSV